MKNIFIKIFYMYVTQLMVELNATTFLVTETYKLLLRMRRYFRTYLKLVARIHAKSNPKLMGAIFEDLGSIKPCALFGNFNGFRGVNFRLK